MRPPSTRRRARTAVVILLTALPPALLGGPSAATASAQELAELARRVRESALDPAAARPVRGLTINSSGARIHLLEGTLFPAGPIADRPIEMVFLGRGEIEHTPADDVEAGQLELFTGSWRIQEPFAKAVLVVAKDTAADALLAPSPAPPAAEAQAAAEQVYQRWKQSPERRLLDVETGIFLDAMGETAYDDYFGAWFESEERGEFLLLVEPDQDEQLTLGQFIPPDLGDKSRRKIQKRLFEAERRGQPLALRLEDLGSWDTWTSSRLRRPDGTFFGGITPFEPARYTLDVTVDPARLTLTGRARIEATAVTGKSRALSLTLPGALTVDKVLDGSGGDLFFLRSPSEVHVVLPAAPAAGVTTTVEVQYHGEYLVKGGERNFTLVDSTRWHPHLGTSDRATYDVTLRWPKRFEVFASGRRVDGGAEVDLVWERRVLEVPVWGFGFEVGNFKTQTARGGKDGRIPIVLAFDPGMLDRSKTTFEQIAATLADSLTYFEERFGPYPYDQLTVVTVPRNYSQALPGFLVLSNFMMIDWTELGSELGLGGLGLWFGFEDRRTVIAHEVAHQWWGHIIGFKSYRDQWISEAMANYAALLWARNRLPPAERPTVGPTSGWQQALTEPLPDGRPVEALGPLVLGARLDSTRGAGYVAIAYQKGAVVLDMLSRVFGEEPFLGMLYQITTRLGGRDLSTEDLFLALERMSGLELDGFARQFVYGTGLPDVYYDYRFEELPDGKHRVVIEAVQEAPWHYAYRVVNVRGDALDVARRRLDQTAVDDSVLVVPFQVVLAEGERKKKESTTRYMAGRLRLAGRRTEHQFEIDQAPRQVRLDRHQEVFGRFYDRRREPKRVLLSEASAAAAAGQSTEAEALYRRTLATTTPVPEDADRDTRRGFEVVDQALDARAHLGLARLQLDAGQLDEAAESLELARKSVGSSRRWLIEGSLEVLSARLELLRGDAQTAYRRLRRGVLKRGEVDSTEAHLLLAIAAQKTGDKEAARAAVEVAREKGADVSLLER
jgi:tetratricopeptide (TPR) repeat protein